MRETVTKDINGLTYEFYQFSATESLKLLTRIAKIVGGPLAAIVTNPEIQKEAISSQVGDASARAVGSLFEKLDEDFVVDTVKKILSQTVCVGYGRVLPIFDTHFKRKMGHLFKVLEAAINAEYDDFFGALLDLKGMAANRGEKTTKSA